MTVEFRVAGEATEVQVSHRALPEGHGEDMYRSGWEQGLDKFGQILSRRTGNA